MNVKGMSGDAHYFEDNVNLERIKRLLSLKPTNTNVQISEKLEGMKILIAMISKGEDVSHFFADVVNNVIIPSVEVKKLIYMYLVHYADANNQCRELALLSINTFQKDLTDENQLIRASALRVMTSIRVSDILQIQIIAVKKCSSDYSPYVRKCAAIALGKLYRLDEKKEYKETIMETLILLLNDTSTLVFSSAIIAYHEICPEYIEIVHTIYRKACHMLTDLEEWSQIILLQIMMHYCRDQFINPIGSQEETKVLIQQQEKKSKNFYSSSEDEGSSSSEEEETEPRYKTASSLYTASTLPTHGSVFSSTGLATGLGNGEQLDDDHRLLLKCSLPLLKSRNAAVVLSVCILHYYCGTQSLATSVLLGKSLVRVMRNEREIQYVILDVIAQMTKEKPEIFMPFLSDFYVKATDVGYIRKLKLEILKHLATEHNITSILKEFQAYIQHSDKKFVKATVCALGYVANAVPEFLDRCLKGLMTLIKRSPYEQQVVAESIVVIQQLLQRYVTQGNEETNSSKKKKSHAKFIGHMIRDLSRMLFCKSVMIQVPMARASIVWMLGEFRQYVADLVPDAIRLLATTFPKEEISVKKQIMTTTLKCTLYVGEPSKDQEILNQLLEYILDLSKYDLDVDLRDRARLIQGILRMLKEEKLTRSQVYWMFLKPKQVPIVSEEKNTYLLSSLTSLVSHKVNGYLPLPAWRKAQPDSSVREVHDKEQPPSTFKKVEKEKIRKKPSTFYSSESETSEEEEESEEASESEASDTSVEESEDESSSEEEESDVSVNERIEKDFYESIEDDPVTATSTSTAFDAFDPLHSVPIQKTTTSSSTDIFALAEGLEGLSPINPIIKP